MGKVEMVVDSKSMRVILDYVRDFLIDSKELTKTYREVSKAYREVSEAYLKATPIDA